MSRYIFDLLMLLVVVWLLVNNTPHKFLQNISPNIRTNTKKTQYDNSNNYPNYSHKSYISQNTPNKNPLLKP